MICFLFSRLVLPISWRSRSFISTFASNRESCEGSFHLADRVGNITVARMMVTGLAAHCSRRGLLRRKHPVLDDVQAIAPRFCQPSANGNLVARCRLAAKPSPDTVWG
jgi:hypothetical protein